MKKLYLLLVALIVAAIPALAADWYLVGSGIKKDGKDIGWNDNETFGLVKVNDGVYTIDGLNFNQNSQFKIKTPGTSQESWNGSISTNGSDYTTLGQAYAYEANNGSNITCKVAAQNATLTLDTNAKTLVITGEGGGDPDPDPVTGTTWTFWDEGNQVGHDFEEVDNKLQVTISGMSSSFKIKKNENGTLTWYGHDKSGYKLGFGEYWVSRTASNAATIGDAVMDYNGEIIVTITNKQADDNQIIISAEKGQSFGGGDPDPVPTTGDWYIIGANFGKWNLADDCKLEPTDNEDVYTKTFNGFNGGEFKFILPGEDASDIWKGSTQIGPSNGQEIQYNQSVTGVFGGGSNFKLEQTSDPVVLTLNVKTGVFKFEKEEAPEVPLTYYFVWGDGEKQFEAEGARLAVRLDQMPAKFHVEGRRGTQLVTRWGQDADTDYHLENYFEDFYLKPGNAGEAALADGVNWQRVMVLITSTKANDDGELTISVLRDFLPSIASNSRWFLEIEGVNTLTEFRFGMAGHYLDYAEVPSAFRVVELKADGTQVTYGTTDESQAGGYETYLTAGARDQVKYLRTSTALTNLSLVLSIVSENQVALQSEALETLPITDELYILGNTFDYASHLGEAGFEKDNSGNVRWHANIGTQLTKIADGVFYGEGIRFYPSYSDDTHSVFSFVTKLAQSADGWSEIENNRLGARIQRYDLAKIDGLRLSFKAYANENAILIEPGVYNVGVNLNTRTVTIMKPNELLDENDDLYIVGDLNYYWHFTRSVKMERSEDGGKVTYTADGFNLVPANAYWWNKDATEQHVNYGRIMIVSKPVEDVLINVPSVEDIESGRVAAPRRADENPVPPVEDHGLNGINLGTRYQVSSTADADGNYSLTPVIGGINDNIEPTELPVGNYKFTITSDANGNKTLSKGDATIQTSVENVADDNADAPVEYYTLQGIRVMEPAAGIYLRRQGTAVTKVLVK